MGDNAAARDLRRSAKDRDLTDITRAGSIVLRERGTRTLYLIITSLNGEHWVLPKGRVEEGESLEEAALRELTEETGVTGKIIAPVSTQCFEKAGEEIAVQYFLVRELSSGEAHEERSLRWEEEQTALQLLTFENTREVLRNAAEVVRRLRRE